MQDVNKRIANLSPEQRELLMRRLGQASGPAEPHRILRRPDAASAPLSFAQERLWFLDHLMPGSSLYNMPTAVRLSGRLDAAALRQALDEIARRHDILRTTFTVRDGRPLQVIAAAPLSTMSVVDLCGLPEPAREAEARRLATVEARTPFDLERGPLMRATLLRLDETEHVVLITLHHIASDGWSIGILIKEMVALYGAFLGGGPSPLTALPIQYGDFSQWQRQVLDGAVFAQQLVYWKQHLDGAAVLDLPTDHARRPVMRYRGAQQTFSLPANLSEGLKDLCRGERATLYTVMLAAFQTLLARYSGQDDVSVGSPIAGRNRTETEGLIGLFINTLVLRTRLSGNPSFSELVARVGQVVRGAYANQDVPFERLVEQLQPERVLNRTPLFQVLFSQQNTPSAALTLPGLSVRPLQIETGAAKFDLILDVADMGKSIGGAVRYNTDLFEHATINRLIGHLETMLAGIVADPAQKISRLPLLTEAERDQLLNEWNDSASDYPRQTCMHRLFEAQAERAGNRMALAFENQRVSYDDLNRRANQLAHYLGRAGLGPEALVGICLERSIEMVVAVLGVLKAGGAYVPLDPTYPKERLAFMLEDARVAALLTTSEMVELIPQPAPPVICVDSARQEIDECGQDNPAYDGTPDNLAYVLYTSGSTGKPKGVQVPQRALINFLISMQTRPGLAREDALLAVTTLSFDIAGLELFLPLIAGARVELATREEAADGNRLKARLAQSGATIMQATPAGWRLLLDAGWEGDGGLKALCGGEALPGELAGELLEKTSALWNMFGPTETTIWSTIHPVAAADAVIAIGGPIANTQVRLLDRELELVPAGVAGELYIGGVGVARGYLGRPELTAERFVPDPFAASPGARLYRTGDLARYLPDGSIQFLGRLDHQVKIRGFRIELGEIETRLAEHPSVRQAVVVAREDRPGDKRLVAYLLADGGEVASVSELRAYLKEKLPDYMLPSAFKALDSFPLTPNGKVDRRALPAPGSERPELDSHYVAPASQVEQVIAAAWREALHLDQVGVNDNFFDLGGHSLLTVQVHGKLRAALNCEIPILDLFRYPTIRALAKHLTQKRDEVLDGRARAEVRKASMKRQRQLRQQGRGASKDQEF